jgi:hypothetical protein
MLTIIQQTLGIEVIEYVRAEPVTALEFMENLLCHAQIIENVA